MKRKRMSVAPASRLSSAISLYMAAHAQTAVAGVTRSEQRSYEIGPPGWRVSMWRSIWQTVQGPQQHEQQQSSSQQQQDFLLGMR